MSKILISGGSGFIGKNLLNYLTQRKNNIMLIGRNLHSFKTTSIKKKRLDLNNKNYDLK